MVKGWSPIRWWHERRAAIAFRNLVCDKPVKPDQALLLLREHGKRVLRYTDAVTALCLAGWSGHEGLFLALLDAGVDPRKALHHEGGIKNLWQQAPTEQAVLRLMQWGAAPPVDGLHAWLREGWIAAATQAMEAFGVRPNDSCLARLASFNDLRPATAQLLLKHGTDPNIPDANGIPAVHWACARGQDELRRVLQEGGADVNRLTAGGRTALQFAEDRQRHWADHSIDEQRRAGVPQNGNPATAALVAQSLETAVPLTPAATRRRRM